MSEPVTQDTPTTPVPGDPNAVLVTAGSDTVATIPPVQAEPVQATPGTAILAPPSVHPIVASVVNSVYNDTTIAPSNAATVAAGILNGIAQDVPAVLQLSRASPRTSGYVAIGLDLLSAILAAFFPHPRA